MGKIKAHGIVFEGSGTYDAGSNLQGHVFIQLDNPLKVRGVRILIRGSAKVQWSESKSYYDSSQNRTVSRTVTYRSSEDYLNTSILLQGVRPNQGNITNELPPGNYKFPFTFTLPQNLPASFEGEHGHVRYYAESNIDLPWKFDPKSKRTFKVRPIADLNSDHRNRYGLSGENEKNLCCLCCKSGPISATFKIEQQGFVPGEAIKLFAEINNDSDRKIDRSYVDLKRTDTFYAEGKKRTQTTRLVKVTRPGIIAHGKDVWAGQTLKVPSTPPSGFPGCHIIDVAYTLKLNVDPAGLSLDLEIPFRIKIGTIPLRREQRPQPTAPHGNMEESLVNFPATSYSSMAPSCYPTAPPGYDDNAYASPYENEAPPAYDQVPSAPPEEERGKEEGPGDKRLSGHSIKKGGYQRL